MDANFVYELNGFKKSKNDDKINIALRFVFKEFNLTIEYGKRLKTIIIPYSGNFKKEELTSIVSEIIREVIEEIKRLSSQP